MYNPLIIDLDQKKDIDLEKSINDLSKKYIMAAKTGNGTLCFQLQTIIEQYKEELKNRNLNRSKKINVNDQDTDLGNLINID